MPANNRPSLFLHVSTLLFGSKRLLVSFLVSAPLLVLFLVIVAVHEMPLPQPLDSYVSILRAVLLPINNLAIAMALELAVRLALIALVMILLYVPVAWVFQFGQLSGLLSQIDGQPGHASEARAEFLGWLTAISVPYLVLGFSMTIEYHSLLEDPKKGVGAIAAIMVLYALSVLSSFLYIEVRDLRKNFSNEMRETGHWFRYSLELANYQTPIGTPAQNVSTLLQKWIELLSRSSANDKERKALRQNLLGTLLTSYIKEESENICGRLTPDRTPVWVSTVKRAAEKNRDVGGVAFIATNVGFYAQYLATAVRGLASSLPKEKNVVLATITYVLPPFWWNWPYANKHHGIYQPIETFRATLVNLAEESASNGNKLRVFRRMLVRKDDSAPDDQAHKLSDRTLNDVFLSTFCTEEDWQRMRNWRVLMDRGTPLTSRVRSPVNAAQLAESIRWTNGDSRSEADESQVYWMCQGQVANVSSESVVSYYNRLMHPSGGASEICQVDFATFKLPFALDSRGDGSNPKGGLNGCPEITFIGSCANTCNDVWNAAPDFELAFLSNMTKGHDSMFLAVVLSEPLVEHLWQSVCGTLNSRVVDDLRINPSA